jgi:hypothetical protein
MFGVIWRAVVAFFADHLEPLGDEPQHEPCGRFVQCGDLPRVSLDRLNLGQLQQGMAIPPWPFIRRDDVVAAIGLVVIRADAYPPELREAITAMAVSLLARVREL